MDEMKDEVRSGAKQTVRGGTRASWSTAGFHGTLRVKDRVVLRIFCV